MTLAARVAFDVEALEPGRPVVVQPATGQRLLGRRLLPCPRAALAAHQELRRLRRARPPKCPLRTPDVECLVDRTTAHRRSRETQDVNRMPRLPARGRDMGRHLRRGVGSPGGTGHAAERVVGHRTGHDRRECRCGVDHAAFEGFEARAEARVPGYAEARGSRPAPRNCGVRGESGSEVSREPGEGGRRAAGQGADLSR